MICYYETLGEGESLAWAVTVVCVERGVSGNWMSWWPFWRHERDRDESDPKPSRRRQAQHTLLRESETMSSPSSGLLLEYGQYI